MCKLRYRTMQKIVKKRATDVTVGFIQDATLCYVKLQTPELAYNEDEGSNYTVDVVVTKDVFNAYTRDYPKNYAKKFTDEEFEEKYKIEPPYSFKGWNYVVKLKAKATIRKDMPEHKLYEGDEVPYKFDSRPKLRDEYGDDVTMDVLVGNGSVGTVAFTILETRKGNFPQLSGVKLSELVHYEADEDAPSKRRWSPFPDDLDDEDEDDVPTSKRSAKKAPAKRSPRDEDDDGDDEVPTRKRPVKKAAAKRAEPEDEDEDEDEDEVSTPKRTVKKAPAKRPAPEPEDDDEEEDEPAHKRPTKKLPAKRVEPEDDDEDEARAPKRPAKKAPAKKAEPEDDDEDEPATKRPAKKAPAKAAEPDEDEDGDDFDDDLPF